MAPHLCSTHMGPLPYATVESNDAAPLQQPLYNNMRPRRSVAAPPVQAAAGLVLDSVAPAFITTCGKVRCKGRAALGGSESGAGSVSGGRRHVAPHLDAPALLVVEHAVRLFGLVQRRVVRDHKVRLEGARLRGEWWQRSRWQSRGRPAARPVGGFPPQLQCMLPRLPRDLDHGQQLLPVLLHRRLPRAHRQALFHKRPARSQAQRAAVGSSGSLTSRQA